MFVQNNAVLSARHSNEVTQKIKNEIYGRILVAVNACGGQDRSLDSIKDKWQVIKRIVKGKASDFLKMQKKERRKTGGGEPEVDVDAPVESILSDREILVLSIFPEESIEGMEVTIYFLFAPLPPAHAHCQHFLKPPTPYTLNIFQNSQRHHDHLWFQASLAALHLGSRCPRLP